MDVEKGIAKKISAEATTSPVVNDNLNPLLESARIYLKLICGGLLAHRTWRSI